jgi:hypothetical protein
MSWSFQIRAYGCPGTAGAKTEMTGRMVPGRRPPAASSAPPGLTSPLAM